MESNAKKSNKAEQSNKPDYRFDFLALRKYYEQRLSNKKAHFIYQC